MTRGCLLFTTATQLKEIIQNSRTSQPVKGLKGQKGSFEATIVLKEDFTTGIISFSCVAVSFFLAIVVHNLKSQTSDVHAATF
jgi:hypothetical protein